MLNGAVDQPVHETAIGAVRHGNIGPGTGVGDLDPLAIEAGALGDLAFVGGAVGERAVTQGLGDENPFGVGASVGDGVGAVGDGRDAIGKVERALLLFGLEGDLWAAGRLGQTIGHPCPPVSRFHFS